MAPMDLGSKLTLAFALLWLVPCVGWFIAMTKRQSRSQSQRRKLLETGTAATAVIVSVDTTGPYYGDVPHLRFNLQVSLPGQSPYAATALGCFRQLDYPRLQPGSTVEIRVDARDNSLVAVIGDNP